MSGKSTIFIVLYETKITISHRSTTAESGVSPRFNNQVQLLKTMRIYFFHTKNELSDNKIQLTLVLIFIHKIFIAQKKIRL